MIPKGKHLAKVVGEAQFGLSKNGTPQIGVTFEIISGPAESQEITWLGFFTEKTEERTLESLRHCGWKGDDISNLGPMEEEVELVIDHEEYEGEINAKVRWVNRPGAGRFKMANPMEGDALRKFAAQMRGKARQIPESTSGKPSSSSRSNSSNSYRRDDIPPPGDDDLPF